MKFTKLTKKLLLSALSLGLAVVTLTTTTFAWYTSNTDVLATGAGSTSGASNDASLLISATENGPYGPSAPLGDLTEALLPVQWNGTAKEFQTVNLDTKEGTKTTKGYITIKVWFKISQALTSNTDIYLTGITIENTTDEIAPYDNLASQTGTGLPTGPYSVDAVHALDLVYGNTAYNLSDKMASYVESEGFAAEDTPNAIEYYNKVMGLSAEKQLKASDETANFAKFDTYKDLASVATITAGETKASATFYVYLNGWDAYCFDACRNQTFDITLNFSTEQPA